MPEIKENDVSKLEIEEYLKSVKNCLLNERYKISDINRDENIKFINNYSLTKKKIIRMLNSLKYEDFYYRTPNIHADKNYEMLYVFKKNFELDCYGELKKIKVYIKLNLILRCCQDYCFIISFHE